MRRALLVSGDVHTLAWIRQALSKIDLSTTEAHAKDIAARLAEARRSRDWEVRNTIAFEELRLFLAEKGCGLDLLFINQPEADAELSRLIGLVRRDHPALRVALEITGQNPDEIHAELRNKVDALLRPNRPDREIVDALARLLPER